MLKIWGRNTSSNVQKVMWAIGEMGLAHERIDIGGPFGKNKEPAYLAMNPNGLVPTLEEEDGFLLWESNSQDPRAREPMDGLAIERARPGDHAGILGSGADAAGET
jgi:Glutathione S-transferase, N-terminal domain